MKELIIGLLAILILGLIISMLMYVSKIICNKLFGIYDWNLYGLILITFLGIILVAYFIGAITLQIL